MNFLSAILKGEPARSGEWPRVRRGHLARQGWCKWCGVVKGLQVHHVTPFHLDQAKELDPENLITLCENLGAQCHLRHGHLGCWRAFNADILKQANSPGPGKRATLYAAPVQTLSWWQEFLAFFGFGYVSPPKVLTGQGWAFSVTVDGSDLVISTTTASWFGGANDPDDDGSTASGLSTITSAKTLGVALPLNYGPTAGSPIPVIPWFSPVVVTAGGKSVACELVDLGPAKSTGRAVDLMQSVFLQFAPISQGLIPGVTVRLPGAAKYVTS